MNKFFCQFICRCHSPVFPQPPVFLSFRKNKRIYTDVAKLNSLSTIFRQLTLAEVIEGTNSIHLRAIKQKVIEPRQREMNRDAEDERRGSKNFQSTKDQLKTSLQVMNNGCPPSSFAPQTFRSRILTKTFQLPLIVIIQSV